MTESRTGDLFDAQSVEAEAQEKPEPTTEAPAATLWASEEAALSDLDNALAHWARRHGADRLVARAFALASWAVAQGHTCLALDAIPTSLMSAANQAELPAALAASELVGEPGEIKPLILENDRLYLQRYHAYETRLTERLRGLMAAAPNPVNVDTLKPGNGLFAPDAPTRTPPTGRPSLPSPPCATTSPSSPAAPARARPTPSCACCAC